MWGEFNSSHLIFVLFCPNLYFMHWKLLSQWHQNWNLSLISCIPLHHHSPPSQHLLFYSTYACTDGTHAHTHAHTNPQLQWLPVNTPASVVYMVLPIEQMLWNLRCKSTPSPPPYPTHTQTHTNPNCLPPPPAGPAMNVPCGAPFPLALWLWLCQLCCVWPPPTG